MVNRALIGNSVRDPAVTSPPTPVAAMQLGSSAIDDFPGILRACHGRIRALLPSLDALIAADPDDPRARATCDAMERYLRDALPLHAQDEDLSLAPRLLDTEPDDALVAALDRMEAEHDAVDAGRRACIAALERWRQDGDPAALAEPRRFLTELLLPHIEAEERDIFPAMSALPAAELAVMLDELRSRRRG